MSGMIFIMEIQLMSKREILSDSKIKYNGFNFAIGEIDDDTCNVFAFFDNPELCKEFYEFIKHKKENKRIIYLEWPHHDCFVEITSKY